MLAARRPGPALWWRQVVVGLVLTTGLAACGADPRPSTWAHAVSKSIRGATRGAVGGLLGGTVIAPLEDRVEAGLATGDNGEIIRAFHDAIWERTDPEAALPELRGYLAHPNALVRYTAAKTLYTAGDDAGLATLVALVGAEFPVSVVIAPELQGQGVPEWDEPNDLRIDAAEVLSKFRERRAAGAIAEAYRRTAHPALFAALLRFDRPDLIEEAWRRQERRYERSMRPASVLYGRVGAREFVPDLVEAFEMTRDPDARVETAWALARMTGEPRYVDYLVDVARECIAAERGIGYTYDYRSRALQYLASLCHSKAITVLEEALDSTNPVAVQYAVVNLLFVQQVDAAARAKARAVLLREIRGRPGPLPLSLMLTLAVSLGDAEVAATARQVNPGRVFPEFWGRRRWPVYNWMDDYVVSAPGANPSCAAATAG